ncbi:hypothetical protein ACFFRR_010457 [Megaselia abdita]
MRSLVLILLPFFSDGANILALLGMPSSSHHIWNTALLYKLAENGHNLTLLSVDLPSPTEAVPKNVHFIHLEKTYETISNAYKGNFSVEDYIRYRGIGSIKMMQEYALVIAKGQAKSSGYKTLMDYPNNFKFDLVLVDYTMGPTILGFVHRFKYPPLIGMTAFLNSPNTIDLIGHHLFPGYIPHWSTIYDTKMTFMERLENTFIHLFDCFYRNFVIIPKLDEMFRPISLENTPYLGDLQKLAKIAFVNSHPAINYPESLPPNVIEVGGMHIKDPKPLPRNIEQFLSKGEKGAIFIAFGTSFNSEMLRGRINNAIFEVIKDLPQYNFLLKFDLKEHNHTIPENVLIQPFFSQRDILNHPNLKAFVTHSGGLSTQEATWFGVPTVGFAIFVDQFRNLKKTVLSGAGVELELLDINTDNLRSAILEVAENPKYKKSAKLRSKRFRSQQIRPLDKAVWWIEYVLTDPNLTHILSPAITMNVFSALSLDVLAVFLVVVVVLLLILFFIVRKVFGYARKSKKLKVT